MAVVEDLSEEERLLLALMLDPSGIDLAEFLWRDETNKDGVFRCYDFQYAWYRDQSKFQIDQAGRCFSADTLVLTRRGQIAISEVEVGDEVLTHRGRWRRVLDVMSRGEQDTVAVRGRGHYGIRCTPDHRFWTASVRRGTMRRDGHRGRVIEEPAFRRASEFQLGHATENRSVTWWSSPVEFPTSKVPLMHAAYHAGQQNWVEDTASEGFLWLYGLYLAEGSVSSSYGRGGKINRVTFSVHSSEAAHVCAQLDELGLRYSQEAVGPRCINVKVNSEPLAQWMMHEGGKGAKGKRLASWVYGLDPSQRQAVVDGAVFGDGSTDGRRFQYSTVSKALAVGLRLLVQRQGVAASLRRDDPHDCVIRGQTYQTSEKFGVEWSLGLGRVRGLFQDGMFWSPVYALEEPGREEVWDLEVEEDASFVADGIVVHNSIGKSLGIMMRAFAFPFHSPGEEMLLTAPELIHLNPITEKVEERLLDTRITAELLRKRGSSLGITHRPFEAKFANGARIVGRIPQKDGKGVKGMHPKQLEMDEAQDYPECFPEGTLVLTRSGYRRIETIQEGDEVFTHRRRWRKVTSTATRVRDTVRVVGQGHPGMVVSSRHRFYAISEQERRVFGGRSVDGHPLLTPVLTFSGPEWVEARDMVGSWWSAPTRFPKVGTPPSAVHVGGRREGMGWSEGDPNTLWLLGLYLADGSIGFRGDAARSVTFTVHIDEEDEVLRRCELAGFVPAASRQVGGSEKCVGITLNDPRFASWLLRHCGHGAYEKQVPAWVYGLRSDWRRSVLAGALFGDGSDVNDGRYQDGRWKFSTVGKAQAAAIKTLATTLGYVTSWYWVQDADEREIRGRRFRLRDGGWYQVVGSPSGQAFDHDLLRYQRVRNVHPGEPQVTLYDLGVEEDESFVVEGVVVHNSGWVELGETLKYGNEDAIWRAHGVSRGVRDRFYKQTQEGSGWTVHRFTAMHRGDWSPQERKSKAELYGSRDHPDYRRNILGLHGDAQSALFVLSRLMACVDSVQSSDYNEHEYHRVGISDERLNDSQLPIEALLRFPGRHKSYGAIWAGMDVGLTNHPSEILIFGETSKARNAKTPHPESILKLLARVHLERISAPDQRRVLEAIWEHYRPKAIAMDRTGLGLPIYQEIMADGPPGFQNAIRPYNFSEKVTVGWEHTDEDSERWWEDNEPKPIMANVLEYSSDQLRLLVDTGRIMLPWDVELVREFQGQTYQITKSSTNPYGRKTFSAGSFHTLDAARMAVLAFFQEQVGATLTKERQWEPVLDSFA